MLEHVLILRLDHTEKDVIAPGRQGNNGEQRLEWRLGEGRSSGLLKIEVMPWFFDLDDIPN